MRRARRAAAAADRPRRAARHRPRRAPSCRASRCSTSTACRRRSRARTLVRRAEARRAEGIVEEEIQALRRLARLARGAADARRAARARPTRSSTQLLAENEGRWEALGERDRERVEAMRAPPSSGCCTSRRCASSALDADAPPRAPAAAARAVRARGAGARPAARAAGRRGARSCAPLTPLRLGTRGSALALAQARWVADAAAAADVEIVEITTAGDRGARRRRQVALDRRARARRCVAGEIDLAVHSRQGRAGRAGATGRAIAARARARADPRDVLRRRARRSTRCREGARVGTSALRRRAQLLAARPDLEVVELRGNVDTRLRKLAAGEVDALVLAAAGLARLGRDDVAAARSTATCSCRRPGQGALARPGARGRRRGCGGGAAIRDAHAARALEAERAAVRGWARLATRRSACTRRVGAIAARVRRPARRVGVAGRRARAGRRPTRCAEPARMLAAGAGRRCWRGAEAMVAR